MPPVAFNHDAFVARYPEFSAVSSPTLEAYFGEAGMYLDNTDNSPVDDVVVRLVLLNMLVAHIAQINDPKASGLVGRINSATEGGVTVSAEYAGQTVSDTKAWLRQTQYGAAFLVATSRFRGFRYVS